MKQKNRNIGAPIPEDFKYLDVLRKGRPQHDRFDVFSIRHPKMELSKRAKIFAPFAALRGFDSATRSKLVQYEEKPELSRDQERELNRRLDILHNLTFNSFMARKNRVQVTVTYFRLCDDEQSEAYGKEGQCVTITGICRYVDPDISCTIRLDDLVLAFDNILDIESPGGVFSAPLGESED